MVPRARSPNLSVDVAVFVLVETVMMLATTFMVWCQIFLNGVLDVVELLAGGTHAAMKGVVVLHLMRHHC